MTEPHTDFLTRAQSSRTLTLTRAHADSLTRAQSSRTRKEGWSDQTRP